MKKNILWIGLLLLYGCAGSSAAKLHKEARTAVKNRRVNKATRLFQEAVDKAPDDILLHRDYQNFMRATQREVEVREEYEDRLSAEPGSAKWLYLLGRLQVGSDIERFMKRSVRADPKFFWGNYGLAVYYKNRSRFAEALKFYKVILRDRRADAMPQEAMINLAICYSRTGQDTRAVPVLRRASQRFPDSPLPPFYLGLVYLSLGQENEGLHQLHESLSRDENFYKVYAPLVQTLHKRGNFAAAKKVRDEARTLYREHAVSELGNEFVIQIQRVSGWILRVTERLSPRLEHPLEPGNWVFVADLVPENEALDFRIRYAHRKTDDFKYITVRSVTDRTGKTQHLEVETFTLESGEHYEPFHEFVRKDGIQVIDRFGR